MKKANWGKTNPMLKTLRGGSQGFAGQVPTPSHLRTPGFAGMKIQTGTPKLHVGYFQVPRQRPTSGHAGSVFGKVHAMRGLKRR